jgi:hypothetical protein
VQERDNETLRVRQLPICVALFPCGCEGVIDMERDYKKEMKQAKVLMYIGILITAIGAISSIIITILFLLGIIEG